MLFRLFLLFTVIPLIELWLLVWVAQQTSLAMTIALVLSTGFIGAALARWQGFRTLQRIQSQLQQGQMPAGAMIDGLLILLAGVVLITPGVLTDCFGFFLLIPPCRTLVKRFLARTFQHRIQMHQGGFHASAWNGPGTSPFEHDKIIDSRIVDAEEPDADPPDAEEPDP